MGWADRALAASKVASQKAKAAAKELATEIDSEYFEDARYEALRLRAGQLAERSLKVAAEARVAGSEALSELGNTEAGARVGGGARKVGMAISTLPIFTALGDSIKARHGVPELHQSFVDRPGDPARALFLAEAMARVQRDLRTYGRARSMVSPTYAVRRQLIRSAVELGDTGDATQTKLMKVAFVRALAQVRANPTDAKALHVMARVYLVQGMTDDALRLAELAIFADRANGLAWVTLARVFLARGDYTQAARAAHEAIDRGAGYGNEVLASLEMLGEDQSGSQRIDRYEMYRSRITADDRAAYLGVAVDANGMLDQIKRSQLDKLNRLLGA